MAEKPTIVCKPDGPYVVTGLAQLVNSRGEPIEAKATMSLCRCGGSANKPFCDGTHRRIGFSGAKAGGGSPDRRDDYRGRRITIHDNRALCAHAGACTDGLPAVFKYGAEPWIDPDDADAQAVIDAIRRCPSGALSYTVDGVEHRGEPREPAITVTRNGPYAITGDVALECVAFGEGASTEHYTLCRCGASKNKPFCDGSHWSVKFADETN